VSDDSISTRFSVEVLVGRGSFGEVFRGQDRTTGDTVAIKRLAAHHTDPIVGERFEREAQMLARIQSPHVVRYVAHGPDDEGRQCLVLEWLEGEDLAARQQRSPLSHREAVDVVRRAALGLSSLHDEGIVHRDVKPSNFFLVGSPGPIRGVRLIDLGIARAVADAALTLDGLRVGTPSYMSPEQARGDERVTPTSDLFSLGVVLYELLTGRRPFTGADVFAILAKIVLEDPPRVRLLAPTVSPNLDALVARAMAKLPERRFATAREMALAMVAVEVGSERPEPSRDEVATMQLRSQAQAGVVERRVVTALFAHFASKEHLARDFALFDRVTREHGGVAHRMLGRRAIAVFGGMRSTGDEALRAGRAGMAFVDRVRDAAVAVVTGRALAASAALSGGAIERGAADTSRNAGAVYVDALSARALAPFYVVEGDGDVLRLGSERDAGGGAVTRWFGREVPCVGRDRELDALDDAWRQVVETGRAGLVIVRGALGVGKSRLRIEWLRRLALREDVPSLLVARGDPMLSDVPLGWIAGVLRSEAGVVHDSPIERQRAAVTTWMRSLDAAADPALAGELMSVPFDDAASIELREARADPSVLRARLRETLGKAFRGLAARGRLVVVLEDLHASDRASIEALDWALDACRDCPLLVVALARREIDRRFPDLWTAHDPMSLDLSPLTTRESETLIRSAMPDVALDADLARSIATRAMGNPLFIEELLRARAAGESGDLPVAIQAAIQVRLDALAPHAKRALQIASVFGTSVWREALRAMPSSGESEIDVDDALAQLVAVEILAPRPRPRFGRTTEYVFRHGLLREAAYAMLPPDESGRIHRHAADWLTSAGEEDDAVLAHHWERAGEPERAAERYLAAARRAARTGEYDAALAHVSAGVSVGGTAAVRAALHLLGAQAAHPVGRYADAIEHATRAAALSDDPTLRLDLAATEGLTRRRMGDRPGAVRILREALAAYSSADDAGDRRRARLAAEIELAWAEYHVGDADRSLETSRAALASIPAELVGIDALVLSALHVRARAQHARGDLQASLVAHEMCIQRAVALGHRWRASGARNGLAEVLLALGRDADARAEAHRALEQAGPLGLQSTLGYAHATIAAAALRLGDVGDARVHATKALRIAEQLGAPALAAQASQLILSCSRSSGS